MKKLAEGQEIGKLVLLAEARLGELFNQLPKATASNNVSGKSKSEPQIRPATKLGNAETPKPKLETARDMGFSKDQVSQFQKLADNPDAVQKAIVTAEERGEIPTRSSALRKKLRFGENIFTPNNTTRT